LVDYAHQVGVKNMVISSVGTEAGEMVAQLERNGFDVLLVNGQTPLPFTNLYKTPQTLGIDRIAAVAGAQFLFPQKNGLVIDAGTCITYDAISSNGEYKGGAISLGLTLRLRALHEFTNKLPLIEPRWPMNLEGNSTEESILAGVCVGLIDEINGKIQRYEQQYSELQVILTGGDADFLGKHLKSNIFAAPLLVLLGLNQILLFNVKKGNWPN
jgi:type III pantothenate kinase